MQTISISGKDFKAVTNSTLGRDVTVMELMHRSGLDSIVPLQGEESVAFSERVFKIVSENGLIFDLMGCLMMPADKLGPAWTAEMGKETAELLRGVTSEEDKKTVQQEVGELAQTFFLTALLSPPAFPRSSLGHLAAGRKLSAAHASTRTGVHSSAT